MLMVLLLRTHFLFVFEHVEKDTMKDAQFVEEVIHFACRVFVSL